MNFICVVYLYLTCCCLHHETCQIVEDIASTHDNNSRLPFKRTPNGVSVKETLYLYLNLFELEPGINSDEVDKVGTTFPCLVIQMKLIAF
jgi:hypothetical protein